MPRKIHEFELIEHRIKMYHDRVIKKPGNECWGWKGYHFNNGYAGFKSKGKWFKAHRFSWELHFGNITEGLIVGHHCDSRECSNPKHIFLGTYAHNSKDMVRKDRQAKGSRNGGSYNAIKKLDEEQVKEIKMMLKNGLNGKDISSKTGASKTQVCRIKLGKHWKHVT